MRCLFGFVALANKIYFKPEQMKKCLPLLFSFFYTGLLFSQKNITTFEKSGSTQTPTYFEIIDWWKKIDERSGKVKMITMDITDAGYPLHLVVVTNNGDYNFENTRKNNKRVLLINNGIHPVDGGR